MGFFNRIIMLLQVEIGKVHHALGIIRAVAQVPEMQDTPPCQYPELRETPLIMIGGSLFVIGLVRKPWL
jgi:hypothetical protein